jgi:hypothetical protein
MVKACSRPRTDIALAAKVEVVRKSPAARRAGSIPAPGTTVLAKKPSPMDGFFALSAPRKSGGHAQTLSRRDACQRTGYPQLNGLHSLPTDHELAWHSTLDASRCTRLGKACRMASLRNCWSLLELRGRKQEPWSPGVPLARIEQSL